MAAKILVTGGAGFIGSFLCEQLINQGNEVICLDNFSTGKTENIAGLLRNPRFSLIKENVNNPLLLEVDLIYNLACPASPADYQRDPVGTISASTIGVFNMLELAQKVNGTMVQASTSEVYGDPLEHPQAENYWGNVNPIGSRSCYDEGKRLAEALCFAYHRQFNQAVKIIRIFNTYGPRMNLDDGRVVPNFILQALTGQDLTIYGDGFQTRSFCYISDLIEGIVKMAQTTSGVTGPVNLGNPVEVSILELAEKVITLTHSSSKIIFCPLPEDDPKQRRPDIQTARSVLDWEPKVNLEDGLKEVINYVKHAIYL